MTSSSEPLISLTHCSVKLCDHWALYDVDFKLRGGERWVLLGENGAGKSVLLKLLRGDMWPTPTGSERRRYYLTSEPSNQPFGSKQHIGLLTPERQDKYVRHGWNHTVAQVIMTGLFDEDIPRSVPNRTQQQRVVRLLKQCKLWSLRQRRFLSLSYGQRRRVLLARILVLQPAVLLLDEVFNGLDTMQRRFLMQVLQGRNARTWIVAAHSSADIPGNATHIARLQQGKLVEAGELTRARRKQLKLQLTESTESVASRLRNKTSVRPELVEGFLHSEKGMLQQAQHERKSNNRRIVTEPIISLHGIELYRDYRPVLKKFDWTINRGEHWAIMGANGSGKSSLLMMLYGDLHPALGGRIVRAGHPKGTPIAKWKQRVGWVSPELQADHFHAGTLENVVASGRYSSVGLNDAITASDRSIVRAGLALVGLDGFQQRGVREVSYGQLRLALLARALVNQPELLLLDEPFTGLDTRWRSLMQRALQNVIATGTQVIMAVHQKDDLIPSINRQLKIEKGGKVKMTSL